VDVLEETVWSGIPGDWGGATVRSEGSRMSREKSDIQLCLAVGRRRGRLEQR